VIDVANLRVGDVVGVDPAYGNDYVATVVKVNKVNIVVEAAARGPELRNWCQLVGFLGTQEDFADKRARGGRFTVQLSRTFIVNYFKGTTIDAKNFDATDTTPILCNRGVSDDNWETLKASRNDLWTNEGLNRAAKEFAALVTSQRRFFVGKRRVKPDYPEKAFNIAIIAAWAFVAGILHNNETRLKRHYSLRSTPGKDALNAEALAKGRHKTDADNYRGLGYRTDIRERGRLVELFYYQAEKECGITPAAIEIAIKKHVAKIAALDVLQAETGDNS